MGIGQLQALQDNGGALVVELEHAIRLDHVIDRAMADTGTTAMSLRRQGCTVTHQAEERRPDAAGQQLGPQVIGARDCGDVVDGRDAAAGGTTTAR